MRFAGVRREREGWIRLEVRWAVTRKTAAAVQQQPFRGHDACLEPTCKPGLMSTRESESACRCPDIPLTDSFALRERIAQVPCTSTCRFFCTVNRRRTNWGL